MGAHGDKHRQVQHLGRIRSRSSANRRCPPSSSRHHRARRVSPSAPTPYPPRAGAQQRPAPETAFIINQLYRWGKPQGPCRAQAHTQPCCFIIISVAAKSSTACASTPDTPHRAFHTAPRHSRQAEPGGARPCLGSTDRSLRAAPSTAGGSVGASEHLEWCCEGVVRNSPLFATQQTCVSEKCTSNNTLKTLPLSFFGHS